MQTRRTVSTYKSRNRRKRDQDEESNHILTSPLSEIDKDETTLSEMNRRMGKRSRLLAASSVPDLSVIADTSDLAPMKKSKRPRAGDDAPVASDHLSTVFNAEIHSNSFQTPLTSALQHGKRASSGYSHHHSASSLSPVPLTKPTFNSAAKENVISSQHHIYLASPFNSQPNSRNASPRKSQSKPKPTKRPRAKSRTLSAHLPENREITAPATDAAPSPDRKKAKTLHHGRNPSLPSFAVDDSPEWLNYAGAKPRKPVRGGRRWGVRGSSRPTSGASSSGSQPRSQLLPIRHPSFSLEVPLAFSTPPANRRLGHSPQDSVNWSWRDFNLTQKFSGADVEGDDEDVEMTDAEGFTPDSASRIPHPTKSRRQTVHVSHDSLFSSMEISGSESASTITGIPARTLCKNTTVNQNTGNGLSDSTSLTSAMSLTGILDPTDTSKLPTLRQAFGPTPDDASRTGRTTDDNGASNVLTKDLPKTANTRKRSTAACLDDLEVLGAKVSEMNLEGLVHLVAGVLCRNADTVIAPLNRSRSMPSVAENNQVCQEEKPVAGSSKDVAERANRKRSDTIRASDYNADRLPQPKVVWLNPAPAPKRKAPARRRSGTITQKDYRAGVRVCRDGRITKIDDGLPLSPQKDDESDDELLLK